MTVHESYKMRGLAKVLAQNGQKCMDMLRMPKWPILSEIEMGYFDILSIFIHVTFVSPILGHFGNPLVVMNHDS